MLIDRELLLLLLSCFSRVRLLETPWTTVYQAPPSMGFSRQEYWSGVPLPSPVIILNVLHFLILFYLQYILGEFYHVVVCA